MLRTITRIAILTLIVVGFSACGGGGGDDTAAMNDEMPATEAAASGSESEANEVTIEPVGNQMQYQETEFTVQAGQEVTVVFNNTATSAAMQHNVVVLNTTDEEVINRVGQAALQAGPDSDYIPEDDAIIAHTPMSKPGETVEVTFTAPSEPGEYTYICTFPGHYMTMRGTMIVEG